jgi:hypothetical protein
MRAGLSLFLFPALGVALAQSSTQSFGSDLSGNRTPGPVETVEKTGTTTVRTEFAAGINGRLTPRERVEERILSQAGGVRILERRIQRYDAEGNPALSERINIEERRGPAGERLTTETVYRSDINGRSEVAERVRREESDRGSTILIERASLDGQLTLEERKQTTREKTADRQTESSVTYRRTSNGNFVEAGKELREVSLQNGQQVENRVEYAAGGDGKLELKEQTVSRSRKMPDGREVTQIDVYAPDVPGVSSDNNSGPKLREVRTIEREPAGNGKVREVVSIREAYVTDPNRLGPPVKIAERVCQGNCQKQ